jgi:hypothetical protein
MIHELRIITAIKAEATSPLARPTHIPLIPEHPSTTISGILTARRVPTESG